MTKRTYQYRYRDHSGGITNLSWKRVLANLHKIGEPLKVKGYRYDTKKGYNQESVMVIGTNGTARFEGFLWGYAGEGPIGLVKMLLYLGIPHKTACSLACNTRLCDCGTDWEYSINPLYIPIWELLNSK